MVLTFPSVLLLSQKISKQKVTDSTQIRQSEAMLESAQNLASSQPSCHPKNSNSHIDWRHLHGLLYFFKVFAQLVFFQEKRSDF